MAKDAGAGAIEDQRTSAAGIAGFAGQRFRNGVRDDRITAQRLRMAAAGQDSWGKNQVILNFLWTAAIGVNAGNPRNDFLTSFDYSRTLQDRGTSWFLGFQQDDASGSDSSAIEEGFVLPFRNGQVELAAEQLSLNSSPQAQFQARVIVNWGRLFARK